MYLQIDLLVHAANVLYLFAFMVRDALWFRALAVVAGGCLIPYFYFRPEPLVAPIYWNLAFTALNIYWICRLLLERRPVTLSEAEQKLCELVFRTMTPREMLRLLKLATWERAEAGERLVERDKPLNRLIVIYSGHACVEVDGRNVAELQPGHFIGSISYVTDEAAPASVVALEPTRYVSWPKAKAPQDVLDSVRRCIATGVAGLSIEDATSDPSSPLYDLSLAVERVRGARQAIDESRADVLLTARAECFLVGHPHPLQESVRRLQAYAEAGADVLFAPGVHEPADIKAIVEAVRPKPFNLLVLRDSGLNVADIAALGVRRISVGPALALAAWTGFSQAAQVLKSEGRFAGFANLVPYNDINEFFTADAGARSGS